MAFGALFDALFDVDKEAFEPSAVSVCGAALIIRLEKVVAYSIDRVRASLLATPPERG
ncbi:hypothetical protein [Trinickia sp. Y13]|uniref:hypothetical protein n=1 Tax=Trinickia sp. Y13 TaxID=2917807 RepID=UPI0024051956|nr:hypothetical protein [Trinickia sp. Y13]MDG0027619.1 hypothetical protein [Trinickia sp. Y13]